MPIYTDCWELMKSLGKIWQLVTVIQDEGDDSGTL